MDAAIAVENLSKRYQIGTRSVGSYRTLRDSIAHSIATCWSRLRSPSTSSGPASGTHWALKDVSFEIPPGEVVGIIGRNGAGKSTLLKILSQITEPTSGRARIRGRVGSLLEVGTGFHPELTGRENVYLNGSILGMSRREIGRKFDEIVEFSEIERFLDTPVKRYSSGMYVRLAFAVAAHLEPEILVVDEVLAVGDVEFQKKCLGKMGNVASEGRTILFVSHNMAAIQRLCKRAIVLDKGRAVLDSGVNECVGHYLETSRGSDVTSVAYLDELERPGRNGSGAARFVQFELLTRDGEPCSEFLFGQPLRVRLTVESTRFLKNPLIGFSFITRDGVELLGTSAHDCGLQTDLKPGRQQLECDINPMVLVPGIYTLRAAIFDHATTYDYIDTVLAFRINDAIADPMATPQNHYVGHVFLKYQWYRN